MRISGVADIMGLFLQPPLEVLPTPEGLVVGAAFSDADVTVRLAYHDHHMVSIKVFVFHQIAGPELLPARPVYLPPWKVAEGGVGTQRGPACTVDTFVVWPIAGGAIGVR